MHLCGAQSARRHQVLPNAATPQLYATSCRVKTGAQLPHGSTQYEDARHGDLLRLLYCMASPHQEISLYRGRCCIHGATSSRISAESDRGSILVEILS